MGEKPKLIHNWKELSKVPESKDYKLDIDVELCNGWITKKDDPSYLEYLSTHTFYGITHSRTTKLLQRCGFNIILDNWDK